MFKWVFSLGLDAGAPEALKPQLGVKQKALLVSGAPSICTIWCFVSLVRSQWDGPLEDLTGWPEENLALRTGPNRPELISLSLAWSIGIFVLPWFFWGEWGTVCGIWKQVSESMRELVNTWWGFMMRIESLSYPPFSVKTECYHLRKGCGDWLYWR